MKAKANNGVKKSLQGHAKGKSFKGQLERAYKSFSEKPKTMKQVSVETNIMRSNLCRYIARLRKVDKIDVAHYGRCPITQYKHVGFYTTDPDLFLSKSNQIKMF